MHLPKTLDSTQQAAHEALQRIAKALIKAHGKTTGHHITKHIKKLFRLKNKPIKGMYLWGGPGRGKTMLMDAFYESIPFKAKQRHHFHPFMRFIHRELKSLEGMKNPLPAIAKQIAKETKLICFDEFFVDDVADAMLLGLLLQSLYHEGVTIVYTSNTPPHELYLNGVQRHRFLPAIDAIEAFSTVMHCDQGTDYRLQTLMQSGVYFSPLNTASQEAIKQVFEHLATGDIHYGETLPVDGREIATLALAHRLIWFNFHALCETFTGANDYLKLCDDFDIFIVSHIPILDEPKDSSAKRFIHLIDVLYDHRKKLVVSAEAPPHALYQGRHHAKAFERTVSRLIEMQSGEYLS